MKVLALSLVALVVALPALAQRGGGSNIRGRTASTSGRAGTLVDSQGRDVRNFTPGASTRTEAGNRLIGIDRRYQTEADLIWRYDTSESELRRAREAVDAARAAFIAHCVNNLPNTQATCEREANEIATNHGRNVAFGVDASGVYDNYLREDLYQAAMRLRRIQGEVDQVRADMGILGDSVRAEIDQGLRTFRSAYNRARHMCHDSGALDAIRSANSFVAATLALQGVGIAGNMVGMTGGGGDDRPGFEPPDGCNLDCSHINARAQQEPTDPTVLVSAGGTCDVGVCMRQRNDYYANNPRNRNTQAMVGLETWVRP
jgi:hypothetical protein